MLGLFRSRPPLDTYEKTWVERRMCWLARQFGIDTLRRASVVHPTEEFFPEQYDGSPEAVRREMLRVGGWLHLDASAFEIKVLPDDRMRGIGGQYFGEERLIHVSESSASDRYLLTSVLAHELSHELLLGQKRLSPTATDHEWVTDLLPVMFGLGIFSANCTIFEYTSRTGAYGYSVIGKSGYLPSIMFGYALAHFAWWRKDLRPAWRGLLRRDARVAMDSGLRYLSQTRKSVFLEETDLETPTDGQLVERLQSSDVGTRMNAVLEIKERELRSEAALKGIAACARDPDVALSQHALRLMRDWPSPLPDFALASATESRGKKSPVQRLAALLVLMKHRVSPAETDDVIRSELDQTRSRERTMLLLQIIEAADSVDPVMLDQVALIWQRAIVNFDVDVAWHAASAMDRHVSDARSVIDSKFTDRELHRAARETIGEVRKAKADGMWNPL